MVQAKLTILGCGNSSGVPAVGNIWGDCDPGEPKNRRSRCSVAIQSETTTIVIDTGPEFREQMNRENIQNLDAVLYTHAHSDHVNGIDELRSFRYRTGALVPIYASDETYESLKPRFHYLFDGGNHEIYQPVLDPKPIVHGRPITIGDIEIIPFDMDHGSCRSTGYRIGDLGYCTDMITLPEQSFEILQGVKTLIIDGAAYHSETNQVHASFEKIFAMNECIQAERVIITSLSLSMDYQTLCKELPKGYAPVFDSMQIDIA